MARKKVTLENVELKPQVIGYSYKKKSNFGRVFLIFVVLILTVYYINDISVFINNLLGKQTSDTINELANQNNNNNKRPNKPEVKPEEVVYYEIKDSTSIEEVGLVLNGFSLSNNKLNFTVNNDTQNSIDVQAKKLFLEVYSEDKTLLQRIKLDLGVVNAQAKVSLSYDVDSKTKLFAIKEKTINDYPNVELTVDDKGASSLTCTKGNDSIQYVFNNNELITVNHTVTNNSTSSSDYNDNLTAWRQKTTTYNNLTGINASFEESTSGYTAVINVDLRSANMSLINEKYYFLNKEIPKVVKFEMEAYGFVCK